MPLKEYLSAYELKWSKGTKGAKQYPKMSTPNKLILEDHESRLTHSQLKQKSLSGENKDKSEIVAHNMDVTERNFQLELLHVKKTIEEDKLDFAKKLQRLQHSKYREHGIGSRGGHIARLENAPGAHNGGHAPRLRHEQYVNIFKDIDKARHRSPPKVLVHTSEWNSDFAFQHSLEESYKNSPSSRSIFVPSVEEDQELFRTEISKFRPHTAPVADGSLQSSSLKQIPSYLKPTSSESTRKSIALNPSSSTPVLPFSARSAMSPLLERSPGKTKWEELVKELHVIGQLVANRDLIEIASLRRPHVTICNIVGYIGLLLGLEDASWSASKKCLLRELSPWKSFLETVSCVSVLSLVLSVLNVV